MKMSISFSKKCQDCDKDRFTIDGIYMYIYKFNPRYASIICSGCAKTKLGLSSLKNKKARETVSYALFFFNSD